MNPSKASRALAVLSAAAVLIFFLWLQIYRFPPTEKPIYFEHEQGEPAILFCHVGLSRDASTIYAPIIEGKTDVTDWHSALYMYECRALRNVLQAFSLPNNGVQTQIVFYYLHSAIFLLIIMVLMYRLVRCYIYVSLLIPVLCGLGYALLKDLPLCLDYFFFIRLLILFVGIYAGLRTPSRLIRILCWSIVCTSLFHIVNYRKSAILIVPFVAWIYCMYAPACRALSRRMKVFLCGVITVGLSLISVSLVPLTLPIVHTSPIAPMLASDMRIAAVLRGEQETFRAEMLRNGSTEEKVMHEWADALTACTAKELIPHNLSMLPQSMELYLNHWKQHPGSMLTARLIQMEEFYCGGTMPWGKDLIAHLYPAIRNNPGAWHYSLQMGAAKMYGRLLVLLAGIVLTAVLIYKRFKHAEAWGHHDTGSIIICLIMLIYTGSYALVPPAAEARYLAPSVFLFGSTCSAWGLITLSLRKQRSRRTTVNKNLPLKKA